MSMEDKFSALIGRLEAVTTKLEAGGGGSGGGGGGGGGAAAAADDGAVSPSVRAFDALIANEVTAYVAAAAAIGDATVTAQAETCKQASVVIIASIGSTSPSPPSPPSLG